MKDLPFAATVIMWGFTLLLVAWIFEKFVFPTKFFKKILLFFDKISNIFS